MPHNTQDTSAQDSQQRGPRNINGGDLTSTATQLAHHLTQLSATLSNSSGSTYGCSPTLYYHSHPHDPPWSARVVVKEPRRRNTEAWAGGNSPEEALSVLLAAVLKMVDGTIPAQGGAVI